MAGIELARLSGSTYVSLGPTNIGAWVAGEGETVLIDSGGDDDAGRKLIKACEATGMRIACIANTHSNADHCGGNAFIQSRTGCRIAAPREEAAFIEHPELEPSFLWGGYPLAPMRNKFLQAKPSRVTDPFEAPCQVPGTSLQALSLPGHYFGMVGFMTPDRVFFAADAAASPAILEKYGYYFVYDVAAHLATLDLLAALDAQWIVPSHSEPTQDAASLAAANKAKILEVGERLAQLVPPPGGEGASPDDLVAALASALGLELNHTQYILLGSTTRSYLAWLAGKGLVTTRVEGNRLIAERK